MKKSIAIPSIILLLIVSMIFISYNRSLYQENKVLTARQDSDMSGLAYWVPKEVYNANPPLILLLDTLFRHTNDSCFLFADGRKEQLKWMKAYQNQLCLYYDRNKLGSDTIPCYAKADTVLNHAARLWKDDSRSNMRIIVDESIFYTWETFRLYSSTLQLLEQLQDEKQRDLFLKEWEAWDKLEAAFEELCSDCVHLYYWGGSACGFFMSKIDINLLKIRRKMLNKDMLGLKKLETGENRGVFLPCAKDLFVNCCYFALKKYPCDEDMLNEFNDDNRKYYLELYDETIKQVEKVKPLMGDWVKARNKWAEETDRSWLDYFQENTSETLIDLSNIISLI